MTWIERQWQRFGPWQIALLPLAGLFGALSALRRALYRIGILRVRHLPVPVVVIGNIAVGGAGKTPLVLWLANFLKEQGYFPGIISRGYGGAAQTAQAVTLDADPTLVGDEPLLLARRSGCPVWIGQDRPAAGQALLQAHPECNVLLSDDGLQHYALGRAVEIAVIDGTRGCGNGLLLPAGPLRESRARLASVDAVVVNGPGEQAGLRMSLAGERFANLRDPRQNADLTLFAGKKLHAVAGIGNPQRFFATLRNLGVEFTEHPFPDHHPYQPDDLAFAATEMVVMTEKDAVKCAAFATPNWWMLAVSAQVDDALGKIIMEKLRNPNGR
ncbi:MAG: tetraacyldisaccharide 4'-kinase [Sulfuricella sp.]|nr:tetraacyldisaccharide 4'-kinase [Sulfuricella sp.]